MVAETNPITLPVLDALFANEAFISELRTKLQLSDEQIAALRKVSSDEVARLRSANAENQPDSAETARQKSFDAIRGVVGNEKAAQVLVLAQQRWTTGTEELVTKTEQEAEPTLLPCPNAVPKDTRIIVNIPAYRMDVFDKGTLVKSYRVGIGYPQFPLPTGLRKAKLIIFNPTWTPPDEPWVKAEDVGQVVPAGSKSNPLGPIKIPIGAPSLIHGGKPLSKIGTFASHGCVGLTNTQVKDFAKVLSDVSQTELSEKTMAAYLAKKTTTRGVTLHQLVPVELRYETIVLEDGKLHIYRDVYNQNSNTEEKLQAVLEANGATLDAFSEEEKTQVLDALNAMSSRPKKSVSPKPSPTPSPASSPVKLTQAEKKAELAKQRKLRNQKEIVVEINGLTGKGYPSPLLSNE